MPLNWRMALWGGHYCRHCGIELDKWGRQIGELRTKIETESDKSLTSGDRTALIATFGK